MKKLESYRGLRAVLAVALLVVTACASASPTGVIEIEHLEMMVRKGGVDPSNVVLPYALTDEMRRWAHEKVPTTRSANDRIELLQDRLLNSGEMEVEYEWGYTGTAREVFEKRRANCLAFTFLFVGMAREVGVPVYFLAVRDSENYRKSDDLVVISDHIAVGYGVRFNQTVIDFSVDASDEYRQIRPISDITAIAMYHSNRGAEALQAGFVNGAVEWLRLAVAIDPELANARANLGVALRRKGDQKSAEEAYKAALEIDPRTYSAYHNLAGLLRVQGREEEARAYEATLEDSPSRNPYTYISLGDISLLGGRLEEAEKLYRRAINLGRKNAEGYAAMGQLAVTAGDLRLARKMLRKARKIDAENSRVLRLEASITPTPTAPAGTERS
ncbi:MAG: tetratricopeptide repeat protein [bacterium]|nr:tetratricopeptide repeat protein [bacterium]